MPRRTPSSNESLRDRCEAIRKRRQCCAKAAGAPDKIASARWDACPRANELRVLLDKGSPFFEVGLWAAYKMYEQWGSVPAAGAVAGIGNIAGVACMIIANDATVKAGAFFPQTAKKLIRAQRIAFEMRAADYLSRRFRRRLSSDAGRNFSG